MPPRRGRRSPAQLAAASRGTATSKSRKLNNKLAAIADLPHDAVDDLVDDIPDLISADDHQMETRSDALRALEYIFKYVCKEPQVFLTTTTESESRSDDVMVDVD